MRKKIKLPIARITIEKTMDLQNDTYVSKEYLLYVKKGKSERVYGFPYNEDGFKNMMEKIEDELKC